MSRAVHSSTTNSTTNQTLSSPAHASDASSRKLRTAIQHLVHSPSYTLKEPATCIAKPISIVKRKASDVRRRDEESPKKRKANTVKRGVAEPEKYAHLHLLQDCLANDLDILICGINPGVMSATKGHHFANPTNQFWKCLHQSGLTDRLLLPSEDFTLPEKYSIGMTNLVERPSIEAAELARSEMRESVPALIRKVVQYRPLILCMVGKTIWDAMRHVMEKGDDFGLKVVSIPKLSKKGKEKDGFGLQRYKILYSGVGDCEEIAQPGVPKHQHNETLIYAVPCTSGRVVAYQLKDKVKLFAGLKETLEALKSGKLNTTFDVTVTLQ